MVDLAQIEQRRASYSEGIHQIYAYDLLLVSDLLYDFPSKVVLDCIFASPGLPTGRFTLVIPSPVFPVRKLGRGWP